LLKKAIFGDSNGINITFSHTLFHPGDRRHQSSP